MLAAAEGGVGGLVVAEPVDGVETAELEEALALDEHAGSGGEVYGAREGAGKGIRVPPGAERVRPPERVDGAAGLLQRAVLVQQHREDRAGSLIGDPLEPRRQPPGLHERVNGAAA